MVAMVVGLILLGGVSEIYLGSKAAYRTQSELGRIQESARFALDEITRDLRKSDYLGCYRGASLTDNVSAGGNPLSSNFFTDPVSAHEGTSNTSNTVSDWTPALDSYFSNGQVVAGSDVLVIQYAEPFGTASTGAIAATTNNIQISGNAGGAIAANDILVISDCESADVFRVTAVSGTGPVTITHATGATANTSNSLSKIYSNDAQLMKMVVNAYYIGTNASGNRSLYRQTLTSGGAMTAQELVEGIETMQLSYGIDDTSDGLPNRYISANSIGSNMDDIVSIRVGLLSYSTNQTTLKNDTNTYTVAGTAISNTSTLPTHGGDRALRQAYNTTIKIRNRGIQ